MINQYVEFIIVKLFQSGMEFEHTILESLNLFEYGSGQRDRRFISSQGLFSDWNDGKRASVIIVRIENHVDETLNLLKHVVVTAQMRVQNLETECPSDWSPMKNELDDLFGTIGSSVDRAWRDLSPGEVGG